MAVNAIAALTAAFNECSLTRGGVEEARPGAVLSSPDVPFELVRAAGLRPFVARGSADPTPAGDAYLEAGVFPRRIRQLVR